MYLEGRHDNADDFFLGGTLRDVDKKGYDVETPDELSKQDSAGRGSALTSESAPKLLDRK